MAKIVDAAVLPIYLEILTNVFEILRLPMQLVYL